MIHPRTHIIGAGLIGTSAGLGLSAAGWQVTLDDADDQAARLAHSIGAGAPLGGTRPDLVIVAVPPSQAAQVTIAALERWGSAVVTDVASVKAPIATAVDDAGFAQRYVGSHPMAGREISGALGAQGDLFKARPWVLCPNGAASAAVEAVTTVAVALEADVVTMDAPTHDAAVARVSHAPQIVASATAAALGSLTSDDMALAGTGLRDVTRIAASEPGMWADIAQLNRDALAASVDQIIADLTAIRDAEDIGAAVSALLARGRDEVARIPGKHGHRSRQWSPVTVIVPDRPGQLLRLLTDVESVDVNIEDMTIEHSPRQPVGLTTLHVLPEHAPRLAAALAAHDWEIAAP